MSSSNREAAPCEAAVYRDERPVGPIRMPMRQRISFVEEFNRIYRGAGIRLEPLAETTLAETTLAETSNGRTD